MRRCCSVASKLSDWLWMEDKLRNAKKKSVPNMKKKTFDAPTGEPEMRPFSTPVWDKPMKSW